MNIATRDDIDALRADLVEVKAMLHRLAPAPEWTPIEQFAAERGVTVATVNRWAADTSKNVEARGRGPLRVVRMVK